jgi:REP element-mobilizing transposase RayT
LTNPSNYFSRRSVRLKEYDYSQPGAYFITILAADRSCIFGTISDDQVQLSGLGRIIEHEWLRLEKRFPYVQLGAWIIMPNHFHGIVNIIETTTNIHPTNGRANGTAVEHFGSPVSGSIPTIIRSFKSSVTQQYQLLTLNYSTKIWHRGYYDHIIRDEIDLENTHSYILNNPFKWSDDENKGTGDWEF